MTSQLYNNLEDTLSLSVIDSSSEITVTDGSKFPAVSAGDYIPIYVLATNGSYEIMHVTGKSGNTLFVDRAREGTDPLTFAGGESVQVRLTRQSLSEVSASDMSVDEGALGPVITNLIDSNSGKIDYVSNLSDLKSYAGSGPVRMIGRNFTLGQVDSDPSGGVFTEVDGGVSALLALDATEGVYVTLNNGRVFRRQYQSLIDVMFGVVGDGSDETERVQSMLNLLEDGDTAYITKLSTVAGLTCNKYGIKLKCEGAAYYDTPGFRLATPGQTILRIGQAAWNIDGLSFYSGDPAGSATVGSRALHFERDDGNRDIDSSIRNCTFFFWDTAIYCKGINLRVIVDNLFSLCRNGIVVDQVGTERVRGTRVLNARFHGRPSTGTGYGIIINGNDQAETQIIGNVADGVNGFYKGHCSNRSTFSDNTHAGEGELFYFNGGTNGGAVHDNTAGGNTTSDGIVFENCSGWYASDNTLSTFGKNGIVVKGSCTNFDLVSNKIVNFNFRTAEGNIYDGIQIGSDCSVGTLAGNQTRTTNGRGRHGINNQGNQVRFGGGNTATGMTGSALNQSASQRIYGDTNVDFYEPRTFYGDAIPTSGTYGLGDTMIYRNPQASGHDRARCTAAGSPGTWTNYGNPSAP